MMKKPAHLLRGLFLFVDKRAFLIHLCKGDMVFANTYRLVIVLDGRKHVGYILSGHVVGIKVAPKTEILFARQT